MSQMSWLLFKLVGNVQWQALLHEEISWSWPELSLPVPGPREEAVAVQRRPRREEEFVLRQPGEIPGHLSWGQHG